MRVFITIIILAVIVILSWIDYSAYPEAYPIFIVTGAGGAICLVLIMAEADPDEKHLAIIGLSGMASICCAFGAYMTAGSLADRMLFSSFALLSFLIALIGLSDRMSALWRGRNNGNRAIAD